VAGRGPLRGQRHPYVYQLVIALQQQGWRWLETYIWSKPNAAPGRFGPRTMDSFECVYAFAKGARPYFDLDAIRVPYKTTSDEIERRKLDQLGRRNTGAGFGRDRTTRRAGPCSTRSPARARRPWWPAASAARRAAWKSTSRSYRPPKNACGPTRQVYILLLA
jgi:hypothetical protein